MKTAEEIKEYVLDQEKQGKVVVMTIEGFAECSLDGIIKQPTEGLLYDLNRHKTTILTFIEDRKWVNDYACMLVIEKLKSKLAEHDKEIESIIDEMVEEENKLNEQYDSKEEYVIDKLTELKEKIKEIE